MDPVTVRQVDAAPEPIAEPDDLPVGSREGILQADDRPLVKLSVPEWKCCVYVATMSGEDRDRFEQVCVDRRKGKHSIDMRGLKALLVTMVTCNAEGTRLFDRSDAPKLAAKSSKAIERIYKLACDLAGLTEEDVKELEGNSGADPSEPSGCA